MSVVDERSGPVRELLSRARERAAALATSRAGCRGVRDEGLDLTNAPAPALSLLLREGRQRLGALARESELRTEWLDRLRRYRLRVAELDELGLAAGAVAVGVVNAQGAELPLLLRACSVRADTRVDARITLHGSWRLSPALARVVRERGADAHEVASRVAMPDAAGGTGDVWATLDALAVPLADAGLLISRRVLLAPVALDPEAVVRDLDGVGDAVAGHPVLSRLTGTGTGTGAGGRAAAHPPLPEPAPAEVRVLDAAIDHLLASPLDLDQAAAVRDVLSGHSVVVDAPPGTGASRVCAAVAVLAAATGRRCAYVVANRANADVAEQALARLGLRGAPAGETPQFPHPRTPGPAVAGGPADDPSHVRQEAAVRVEAALWDLRRVRDPWQVSRLDVLDALAVLDGRADVPTVEWPEGPDHRLPLESVHRVVDAVQRAVVLGLLEPAARRSPWRGMAVADVEHVQRVLPVVEQVAGPLAEGVSAAVAELAQATGTAAARTLNDLRERRELFKGLRATLDRLRPDVFDTPVDDLVSATAPRDRRDGNPTPMAASTRRRLLLRARELVRPGVDVKPEELHSLLSRAAEQRSRWKELSGGAGWAHVPSDVPRHLRALDAFLDAVDQLAELHPDVAHARTYDEVVELARRLVATREDTLTLPERVKLKGVWSARGLSGLVDGVCDALREGRHDDAPGLAGLAVWRSWWSAVARSTQPGVAEVVEASEALRRHAAAEARHRAGAALRAREAMASQPGSVSVLTPAAAAVAEGPYDVVVLDDAGELDLSEVIGPVSRGTQLVAAGHVADAPEGSALAALDAVPHVLRHRSLRQRHRPVPVPLAAASQAEEVAELQLAASEGWLTFTWVEDAAGLPVAGQDHVDTNAQEVARVVDLTVRLARAGWDRSPVWSLAVVALTREHAAAVAVGLRERLRAVPADAEPFTSDVAEPVVVVSADQARGLERDVVILTTGFPRTPHGRVLHRFGVLDDEGGDRLVRTAVTRSRRRLHVVSGLRSQDLDPSRLRGAGSRQLATLLAGAELAQSAVDFQLPREGPAVRRSRASQGDLDRVVAVRRGGEGDGSRVLDLLAADLVGAGVDVRPGPLGGGLLVRGGRELVVDLDVGVADTVSALARSRRLAEGDWDQRVLAVEEFAARRTEIVEEIIDVVGPLPATHLASESGPVEDDLPTPGADAAGEAQAGEAPAGEAQAGEAPAGQVAEDPGGVQAGEPSGPRAGAARGIDLSEIALPVDDRDVSGAREDDNDDRLLADRPPHW